MTSSSLLALAKRVEEAEAELKRVEHGRRAFLGSSAWNDYVFASREVDNLTAEYADALKALARSSHPEQGRE
ncbi:MAG TPA: hypothetical protein VEA41_13530 [Salinarimonas sp.]|nr:hypothetical protein [Salinarimonas sp.]